MLRINYRAAGLVFAAIVAGSAGTHVFDQRFDQGTPTPAPAAMPAWTASCQAAIDATAELHRFQVDEAMQGTWAIAAGLHVKQTSVDTSRSAQLQRDVDEATARCLSPATPPA